MRKTIPSILILSLGIAACTNGTAADPAEESVSEESAAISLCGPMPRVGECNVARCISADRSWEIDPKPAGTRCSVGTCDGDGTCVRPDTTPPPPPPTPTPRVMDFVSADISEIQADFEDGGLVTFETRNCTAGADPVLHLFKPGPNSETRIELAADDNSGGGTNAKITATVGGGSIGFVVLHAKNDAYGTCDIYKNGLPWRFSQSAGGKTVHVVANVGDTIDTVSMPHGGQYQAIYEFNTTGLNIVQKVNSGTGTALSAHFSLTSKELTFLVHGSGPTRVIVNDVNSDADGDGLGNALEAELGTCSTLSGFVGNFDCSTIKTPKDTDGDGLSDAWEVLGKRDVYPHQTLPMWGANPRHKDAFVEVDFRDDGQPYTRLSPEEARVVGSYWQDTIDGTPTPLIAAYRAALLKNPDGLPGISMHLDTGLPPPPGAPASDYTLYGSWGGFDIVPSTVEYPTGWQTYLSPARRGVFHWVLGVRGGGGQTSGFPSTANIYSGAAIAHELGHTVGLEHYGADSAGVLNCKPNYASPMNYAYSYQNVGFSDGVAPAFLNNVAIGEYNSLLNAPNREHYADLYQNVFGYYVDRTTWSVDFDRDGDIAAPGAKVRAYANSLPGGSCEGTRERRTGMNDGHAVTHSPAIVHLDNKVLAFAATGFGLELRSSTDTYFNCTAAGGGNFDNPCGTFGSPLTIVSDVVVAVDAAPVPVAKGVPTTVAFVFVDGSGNLRGGSVHYVSGKPVTVVSPNPIARGLQSEPSVASEATGIVRLAFKDSTGQMMESRFINNAWGTVFPATSPNGPFHVSDAPAIIRGRMPGDTADAMYMHATHDVQGFKSSTWLKLASNGWWTPTTFGLSTTERRPGLAYVPNVADPSKGKMYAVYLHPGDNQLRVRTSGVTVSSSGTRTPMFGFEQPFDNEWATAWGVDLMFEPGLDTNLRAAVIYNFGTWNTKVVFQPLADGIVDLSYGTFNDWEQMGLKACASIANPGSTVANPMACF